jgi:hypothetical protein
MARTSRKNPDSWELRLAADEPSERMKKLQTEGKGARGGTKLQVTGWLVNTQFAVAVRMRTSQ